MLLDSSDLFLLSYTFIWQTNHPCRRRNKCIEQYIALLNNRNSKYFFFRILYSLIHILDESLMRSHHLLPMECVTLRASQFVLSFTCPNDKVIDVIIENMGGQLTLAPSLGEYDNSTITLRITDLKNFGLNLSSH